MERPFIKPAALRPGHTIGIAAPSSPFDRKHFERGIGVIESMGYRVKVPANCFNRRGYLAGSDTERAELLMEMFCDESIRAICCARGGFGCLRLLPLLDFGVIAARPKILLGFSDITALLVAVYERCHMVTFHGPVVTTLRRGTEKTCAAFVEAVASTVPLALKPSTPVVLNPGQASGPLVGGNLTTLCHLLGTPYEPRFDGHLLFLEDRGEAPYRIDRILSQLTLGGHLDGVAGVILGSFQDCGGSLEEVYDIVKEAFHRTQVPILAGFDLGHGADNLTIPIGVKAALDTEKASLQFDEPAVSGSVS